MRKRECARRACVSFGSNFAAHLFRGAHYLWFSKVCVVYMGARVIDPEEGVWRRILHLGWLRGSVLLLGGVRHRGLLHRRDAQGGLA
jgi:hypothetical protein